MDRDLVKRGLLFAGTDRGVYVSFDDGVSWQSLRRNLPMAIVTDLLVKTNDLIASTQGRAIWVLNDVSPLRGLGGVTASDTVHLFTQDAIRTRTRRCRPASPWGRTRRRAR